MAYPTPVETGSSIAREAYLPMFRVELGSVFIGANSLCALRNAARAVRTERTPIPIDAPAILSSASPRSSASFETAFGRSWPTASIAATRTSTEAFLPRAFRMSRPTISGPGVGIFSIALVYSENLDGSEDCPCSVCPARTGTPKVYPDNLHRGGNPCIPADPSPADPSPA